MKVDWLILADGAQVTNNKLFLLGGGWDILTVAPQFPVVHRCALAIAIRVGWHEAGQKHAFELQVVHDDGATLANLNGEFEVARAANLQPGQEQRVQFAANLDLSLPAVGGYAVVALLDGQEADRTPFRVVTG